MYFVLQSAQRLLRDRPRKGGVAEQSLLRRAVLSVRGPTQMELPDYRSQSEPVATRTTRFGGGLVELQYAALPPLHTLQRHRICTKSRAEGLVREI